MGIKHVICSKTNPHWCFCFHTTVLWVRSCITNWPLTTQTLAATSGGEIKTVSRSISPGVSLLIMSTVGQHCDCHCISVTFGYHFSLQCQHPLWGAHILRTVELILKCELQLLKMTLALCKTWFLSLSVWAWHVYSNHGWPWASHVGLLVLCTVGVMLNL